jgi:ABC-type nitrate/sulfonate/bicarbonate transport system substrate-binding protein
MPLAAAILLAACGTTGGPAATSSVSPSAALSTKPAASAAAAASGKPLVKLIESVPAVNFGTSLATFVAQDQGFFRDEGLEVETPTMTPPAAVAGVLSGQVDFAVAGSGIRAAMQGAPTKAIFFHYNTVLFELVATSNIKTVADLKGKRVGQSGANASDAITSDTLLRNAGLDPGKDVTFVTVPGGSEIAAMSSGAIDAESVTPDVGAKAVTQGMHILVPVQEVGKLQPSPFSGWNVSDTELQTKHDTLLAWARANIRALEFMVQHPQETETIAVKAYSLDPQVAHIGIPSVLQAIDPNDYGGFTDKGIQLEIANDKIALKNDFKVADVNQLVDLSILHEAQKQVGVPCKGGYSCG